MIAAAVVAVCLAPVLAVAVWLVATTPGRPT